MYRWGLKRYKFFNKPNVLQEQRCKCKETHESVSNPMFTKTQDTLGVLANISEWFTSSGWFLSTPLLILFLRFKHKEFLSPPVRQDPSPSGSHTGGNHGLGWSRRSPGSQDRMRDLSPGAQQTFISLAQHSPGCFVIISLIIVMLYRTKDSVMMCSKAALLTITSPRTQSDV